MAEEADRRNPDDRVNAERRPRARKDRKRWCRGKEGREHQPIVVFRPAIVTIPPDRVCGPPPAWYQQTRVLRDVVWQCWHREECSACGRVLNHDVAARCPDRFVPLRAWLDSPASAHLPAVVRAGFERTEAKTPGKLRVDRAPHIPVEVDCPCPGPPRCYCQEGTTTP